MLIVPAYPRAISIPKIKPKNKNVLASNTLIITRFNFFTLLIVKKVSSTNTNNDIRTTIPP